MVSFNDIIHKYKLKKTASTIRIQQVLSSVSLSHVGICFRDGPFKTDEGIVKLHPSKETRWVFYIH